jgi:hypothetical protein
MPPAGTLLNLPLRTPPTRASIEEEDNRNKDDLPSNPAKETTHQEGDEKETITQIKI